jgi:MYXO-CTERM domain-containing protein
VPNQPDDNFPTTLVDQITDRPGGGRYSQDITFPDQECDNCTLQLIQVMTTSVPYNSFYFQCADITLSNSQPGSPDADVTGVGEPIDGCGCRSSDGSSGFIGSLLVAMLLAFPLRRRSRQR